MPENDKCPKCRSKMIVQDVDGKMRCLDCSFKWPQNKLPAVEEENNDEDWLEEEESNDSSD